jgi:hypothetical protein
MLWIYEEILKAEAANNCPRPAMQKTAELRSHEKLS